MKQTLSHVIALLAPLALLASGTSAWAGYGAEIELNIKNGDTQAANFEVVGGVGFFGNSDFNAWTASLQPGESFKIRFNHDPGSDYDDVPGGLTRRAS